MQMLAHNSADLNPALLGCKMCIMTSQENHHETVQFFESNNYFGAPKSTFKFFPQAMLPAIDSDGKILMNEPHQIKLAPNGNGAVFDSLRKNEDLKELL